MIGPRDRHERGNLSAVPFEPGPVDGRGKGLDRRMVEQRSQGQFDAKRRAHAGHDLRGEKRMAAEFKKLIPPPDAFNPQNFRPDSGYEVLRRRRGRFEIIGQPVRVRCGQRLPVDFSIRCER